VGGGARPGSSGAFTSSFAAILDGHSRISPTNLSAVAAAARDGGASVRRHESFSALFAHPDGGVHSSEEGDLHEDDADEGVGHQAPGMVPLGGGSPMQLAGTNGVSPARRPARRRALDFDAAASPLLGRVPSSPALESFEAILPIPALRDGNSALAANVNEQLPGRGVFAAGNARYHRATANGAASMYHNGATNFAGTDEEESPDHQVLRHDDIVSLARSPISMRPGITRREDIIDSPAVKEATNAAVKAALEANSLGYMARKERRPQRAAAAGAAAAAAAAAASAATGLPPSSRRSSALRVLGGAQLLGGGVIGSEVRDNAAPGVARCNCKKSRCLKLYCDCFKAQGFCGDGCSCVSCCNREDNASAVVAARYAILSRNPQAFNEKITDAGEPGVVQHRKGCNCKKSRCLKKYCECFQAGVPCGDYCKCETCCNTVEAAAAGKVPYKNIVRASIGSIGSLPSGMMAAPTPMAAAYPGLNHEAMIHSTPSAVAGAIPAEQRLEGSLIPNGGSAKLTLGSGQVLVAVPDALVHQVATARAALPHLTPLIEQVGVDVDAEHTKGVPLEGSMNGHDFHHSHHTNRNNSHQEDGSHALMPTQSPPSSHPDGSRPASLATEYFDGSGSGSGGSEVWTPRAVTTDSGPALNSRKAFEAGHVAALDVAASAVAVGRRGVGRRSAAKAVARAAAAARDEDDVRTAKGRPKGGRARENANMNDHHNAATVEEKMVPARLTPTKRKPARTVTAASM
jgi:hypothetical protein